MRKLPAVSAVVFLAVVAFSSRAMGQAGAAANNSVYDQLADKTPPGGPAPVHDISGLWTGPINAKEQEVPPLTPLGQKLFSQNKSQAKYGEAASNDPWKTCDPFGFPRSTVTQIRFVGFAQMPGRMVVLDSYERIGAMSGWTVENSPRMWALGAVPTQSGMDILLGTGTETILSSSIRSAAMMTAGSIIEGIRTA